MELLGMVATVLVLVAIAVLWNTLLIVPAREEVLKERFGKFADVLQAGFHLLLPFVDRVAYRLERREQVIDIPPQSCITKDNIQVEVDGLVFLKVVDSYKASYGIANYRRASINLAQTTMRSEIGKLTLEQTFSERENINQSIVKEIDRASDPWGIKMLRYEIKNIAPSLKVLETLEKQMEAERQKRAQITLAVADKEARINVSEGERQAAINLSEGDRQRRINEASGRSEEIALLATASASAITAIATAIRQPGGAMAVKMEVLEQFIEAFGRILEAADVSVVPAQLATLQGFFEGIGEVAKKLPAGSESRST
ncbi:MAG: paraslipin [Vicinamibacterales bacterium]|nr:paraslipin [Vicinamibacterales bacterium]